MHGPLNVIFSTHFKYGNKVVPTGNRAPSTNINFKVGVKRCKLLSHVLPSVYRSLTFSVCYANCIFTISECCRDSFGEIVCSAADHSCTASGMQLYAW